MKKIFLLFCLIFIFSCKEKKEEVLNNPDFKIGAADRDSKIPDSSADKSILLKTTDDGFFRIFVKSNEARGKYFYSDTLNVLMAENYIKKDNKFIKTRSSTLLEGEWNYLEIDSANLYIQKINNVDFQFISANDSFQGKAIPEQSVHFWMINTNNVSEYYELIYSGYPDNLCAECIKGDFVKDKKLDKNPFAKKALYDFAKKSKLIYQKTNDEKKPNHFKNFREKWQKDNQAEINWGAGYGGEMDVVLSTYYKENLFDISGGTEASLENQNYYLTSYFRGDVIGFDKQKKRYFPIIVESCAHFCNKEIEFVNDHTIKITYEDDKSWELDLTKIKFNE